MITQKMAASKDIAATWGGGRAEGAGRPSGPVRNGPDRSGPPLPCRGLDPCSSPVFCRQVESLQTACRHQARCRTHVTPSLDVHHHGRTQQELAAMSHKPESAAGRCFRGRQEQLDLPRRVPTLLSKTPNGTPDQRGPCSGVWP